MTLLEQLKRGGVGILLDEGSARAEFRRLSQSLGSEFDEVYSHLLARGASRAEINNWLRPPAEPKPNGHAGNGADHGTRTQSAALAADVLELVRAADLKIRAVRWLWLNRFALGKLGIIGGLPDRGKGCITSDMIARVTNGLEWPCREGRAIQGDVILLTAEDDLEDTVIPRLVAAGADQTRVHIVRMVRTKDGKRLFSLISDLPLLKQKLKEIGGVVLVVIDPLSAYFGVNKFDSYRTSDVRGVLAPLKDLAEEARISIIGIMHFNKNTNVTSAMLRLSDSLAFVAASRHAYVVVDDPDGKRRLFTKAKNNVASQETKALAYNLEGIVVGTDDETKEPIVAPRVVWALDHVDMTADQALAAEVDSGRSEEHGALDEAIEFLRVELVEGRVEVTAIQAAAKRAGISDRTLKRARAKLGVIKQREGFGPGGKFFLAMPTPIGGQENA
jgi:putative DNA primase/helicase